MKKYFQVVAKCGHVGRKNYIEIAFPIIAESINEATQIARNMPRVKHHMKDAISSASEITEDEYLVLRDKNDKNAYLKCTSIQEQRMLCGDMSSLIHKIDEPRVVEKPNRGLVGFRRQKEREYLESLFEDTCFLQDDSELLALVC